MKNHGGRLNKVVVRLRLCSLSVSGKIGKSDFLVDFLGSNDPDQKPALGSLEHGVSATATGLIRVKCDFRTNGDIPPVYPVR